MVDALNILIWHGTDTKRNPRPKQIPRPGVKDGDTNTTRLGGAARPLAEIDAILRRARHNKGGG